MRIEKKNVVLDTNIIISAAISKDGGPSEVLKHLAKGDFFSFTTKEIIDEINSVFEKDSIKRIVSFDYKEFILNSFIASSVFIEPEFDERAVIEDEQDNKFINCALTAKANIISGDSHLLRLEKYKGIRILSPKEFLESLKC